MSAPCIVARVLPAEVFTRLVADQAASGGIGSWAARECGLLTVFGTISSLFLLAGNGEVLIDHDEGVFQPANSEEREFAYVQAARRYPELRSLAPERPPSARTCQSCGGSGGITLNDGRHTVCCATCNTRGWTAEP
jgi:hypothetical protein